MAIIATQTTPTLAPQGQLGRYVLADLKGGEVKHNYLMSVIATAIHEALKGNARDIKESIALTQGKAKKARAYHAGFAAIADLAPVKYTGKLDSADNKAVREAIATKAQALEFAFEGAYLVVVNEPTVPKAKKTDPAPVKEVKAATDAEGAPVMTVDTVVVDIAQAVDAVADALKLGMIESGELALLRLALSRYDEDHADAPANVLAALAKPAAAPAHAH